MADERNNITPAVSVSNTEPMSVPGAVSSSAQPQESAEEVLSKLSFTQLLDGVAPMVRAYILSKEFDQKNTAITTLHKLSPEDEKIVLQTEVETFLGLLLLQDFPDAVWDRLPWLDTDEDRCRKMVVDILGNIMRPARKYLGDVDALITELGGNPESYTRVEVAVRTLPFDEAFVEVYKTIDPEHELDEEQRGRISAIMKEQMIGKSTPEESLQRYMRPIKLGGAEMEEGPAALITSVVSSTMLYTNFVEPEPEPVEEEEVWEGEEESGDGTVLASAGGDGESGLPPAARSASEGGENSSAGPAAATTRRRPKNFSEADIRALYNGTPEEREHITETVEKLMNMPNGRDKAIAVAFAGANVRRPPYDIIGALFYLAQDGTLLAQANEDPRYSQQVAAMLKDTAVPVTPEQVVAAPAEPRFVAAYLENQLVHGAALLPKDAARIALRIASLLKKNGWNAPDIAAFDPALGAFRFTQDV